MSFEKLIHKTLADQSYTPVTKEDLASLLRIRKPQLEAFFDELEEMLAKGKVARLKRDRIALPADADLISGVIIFRQSGSGFLVPDPTDENPRPDRIDVRAEDTATAMHKDRVLARLIPPRKSGKGGAKARGNEAGTNARVIRILERARQTITGTLKKSRLYYYVIPDDPRIIQDILVPDPAFVPIEPAPVVDDKVLVRLEPWEQRHLNPEGEILSVIGKAHAPDAEHQALLLRYNLDPDFPADVMAEVTSVPGTIRPAQVKDRKDCRKLFTFTIDPDDAKDFDDALSVEKLKDGKVRIGIHIADVSAYVRVGTALDKEAQRRGNSTYLVGQVIPMLPHKLSNGICSLVEAEDRLTKSVFITFDKKGKMTGQPEFANTAIRSFKRLTYKQAYALMNEDANDAIRAIPLPPAHQTGSTGRNLADMSDGDLDQLRDGVRTLWSIASRIRERRMKEGALDLDMAEVKIFVDEEGRADRIERITNDESHQLIEEYMLLANEAVCRFLEDHKYPLIHRAHDAPNPDRLDELREFMATVGIEVGDLTDRREVTKLLAAIKSHPQSYTLRIEFLRSLQQACYRAESDGHYGLNKTHYGHFTSPIRRYSDLVVHRQFDALLTKLGYESAPSTPSRPLTKERLTGIAQHLSITEQNSTEAEREHVKVKLLEFFERELKREEKTKFEAVITDIKNHGMFIELTVSQAWGLVHISTLRDDLYYVAGEGTKLVGRKTRKEFLLGQLIQVRVERVDRFKRQIDFAVIEQEGAPLRRGNKAKKPVKPKSSGGAPVVTKAARKPRSGAQKKKTPTSNKSPKKQPAATAVKKTKRNRRNYKR